MSNVTGSRSDYLAAVTDEFAGQSQDALLRQIAHCWRERDRMQDRLNAVRADRDAQPRRNIAGWPMPSKGSSHD